MRHSTIILVALVLGCSVLLYAQVPQKVSYQGMLTTSLGTPVQDGSYNIRFDLHNLPVGGTLRHTETHTGVGVLRGVFSVILGPLPAIFNESLYVELTALSGPGISSPMTFAPRSELTSAPYPLAPWVTSGNNIYYNTCKVGIGTTAPNEQLEITGNLRLPASTASVGVIKSGADRFIHNYGTPISCGYPLEYPDASSSPVGATGPHLIDSRTHVPT